MADLNCDVMVSIRGDCLVCREPVREGDKLKLVEEAGHYAEFLPDGRLVWVDVVFGWVHLQHTN